MNLLRSFFQRLYKRPSTFFQIVGRSSQPDFVGVWARHNAVPGKPSSPHQHRSGAEYGILQVLSGYTRGYLPGYLRGTYVRYPKGLFLHPLGYLKISTPGVPIQGALANQYPYWINNTPIG